MAILPIPGDAVPARLLIAVRKGAHGSTGEVEDLHAGESARVYRVLDCGQVLERIGPGREEIGRYRGIEDTRALSLPCRPTAGNSVTPGRKVIEHRLDHAACQCDRPLSFGSNDLIPVTRIPALNRISVQPDNVGQVQL